MKSMSFTKPWISDRLEVALFTRERTGIGQKINLNLLAPLLRQNSLEILLQLGYTNADIVKLKTGGVVKIRV